MHSTNRSIFQSSYLRRGGHLIAVFFEYIGKILDKSEKASIGSMLSVYIYIYIYLYVRLHFSTESTVSFIIRGTVFRLCDKIPHIRSGYTVFSINLVFYARRFYRCSRKTLLLRIMICLMRVFYRNESYFARVIDVN